MVTEPAHSLPRPRRSLAAALSDPWLRIPLTYFIVAQLLDILTTLSGLVIGLDELNPVSAGVLHHFGAFGLLLQKVPVVVAMALAVAFLPRRLAVITTWALTLVMAGVIASNAASILALHSH